MRNLVVFVVLAAASACGPSGPLPSGGLCNDAAQPECTHCCSDYSVAATCEGTTWKCPDTFVDARTCTQSCAPPPSSKKPCVDRDAGVCLGCDATEVCVTTFRCVDAGDGGIDCSDAVDAGVAGDDRCHAFCNFFDQCGSGETCTQTPVPTGCQASSSSADRVCL